MIGSIFRVLIGFVLATLAAGITLALFVTTPMEIYAEVSRLPADVAWERLAEQSLHAALTATALGIFAAPLALVAIGVSEWRGIRAQGFYLLVAVAIALLGFFVQQSTEAPGAMTILNKFALAAFLTTGFSAGTVYWLVSGRSAGAGRANVEYVPVQTQPIEPQANAELAGSVPAVTVNSGKNEPKSTPEV